MTVVWIVIAAVIVVVVVIVLISKKVFDVAVSARVDKNIVLDSNADDAGDADPSAGRQNRDWLRSRPFEEWRERAPDGTALFTRVLHPAQPSDVWVFCLHGFAGTGLSMGNAARHFHERGFHVVLPDLRGCGNTGGAYLTMGWMDAQDMLLWIGRIADAHPDAKIILTGGSMGGATVMMTTGLALPPNVVAAVEDCGYTNVWDEFTYQLKKVFGLPQFPFMYIGNLFARTKAGYDWKKASSTAQLKKSGTPTLFIHGDADEFVPFYMLEENYAAAACEKQKLVVPGAGHGLASVVAPELYWRTADDFIDRYLHEK